MNAWRSFTSALAIVAAAIIVSSNPSTAQLLPPTKRAEHVKILKEPELEIALDNWAIVRWTSTNPGGDDDHYAVAHYGMDPRNLNETARSHIRLNRTHPETIFRVWIPGLKPQTTYYYWVTSMGGDGTNDGVKSGINHFTTAATGKRIIPDP